MAFDKEKIADMNNERAVAAWTLLAEIYRERIGRFINRLCDEEARNFRVNRRLAEVLVANLTMEAERDDALRLASRNGALALFAFGLIAIEALGVAMWWAR